MAEFLTPLVALRKKVDELTKELSTRAKQDPEEMGAAAVDYLRLIGHLVFAYFWARMAKIALQKQAQDPFYKAKLATARFYFGRLYPRDRGARSERALRRGKPPRATGRSLLKSPLDPATTLPRKRWGSPEIRRCARGRRTDAAWSEHTVNNLIVKKVAVLGAGVMGAQIAAHAISAKVPVILFDLPSKEGPKNKIVLDAIENLKKLNPAPLANKDDAAFIEPANYEDDLGRLKECDLVIEAIAERMDWKHDLYKKVAPHLAPHAIFASNTSGLSITALSEGFDAGAQVALCRRALLQSAAVHAPGRAHPHRRRPSRRSWTGSRRSSPPCSARASSAPWTRRISWPIASACTASWRPSSKPRNSDFPSTWSTISPARSSGAPSRALSAPPTWSASTRSATSLRRCKTS